MTAKPKEFSMIARVEMGPADSPVGFVCYVKPDDYASGQPTIAVWSTHSHTLMILNADCVSGR
jgi:hypothetical protein